MWLFDVHPVNSDVDRSPKNHLAPDLIFQKKNLSRCRTPAALSATAKVDRVKRSQKIPLKKYAPLGEIRRMNKLVSQALLGETQCFNPQGEESAEPNACWS